MAEQGIKVRSVWTQNSHKNFFEHVMKSSVFVLVCKAVGNMGLFHLLASVSVPSQVLVMIFRSSNMSSCFFSTHTVHFAGNVFSFLTFELSLPFPLHFQCKCHFCTKVFSDLKIKLTSLFTCLRDIIVALWLSIIAVIFLILKTLWRQWLWIYIP